MDEVGQPVEGASVEVIGRDKEMRTSRRGEFWRLLLPGAYTMRAWHRDKYGYMESNLVCVQVGVICYILSLSSSASRLPTTLDMEQNCKISR